MSSGLNFPGLISLWVSKQHKRKATLNPLSRYVHKSKSSAKVKYYQNTHHSHLCPFRSNVFIFLNDQSKRCLTGSMTEVPGGPGTPSAPGRPGLPGGPCRWEREMLGSSGRVGVREEFIYSPLMKPNCNSKNVPELWNIYMQESLWQILERY